MNDKLWATISKEPMPKGTTHQDFRQKRIKFWKNEDIKDTTDAILFIQELANNEFYQRPKLQELLQEIMTELHKQRHQLILEKIDQEKYGVELNDDI